VSPRARAVMLQATGSHAGKTVLAAGLCRLLARRGLRVAPFKAQNMSLNAHVAAGGGEMGWAQVMQAEAAGVPPRVEMNPILLKPFAEARSQVVLLGRALHDTDARGYYCLAPRLWPAVRRSSRTSAAATRCWAARSPIPTASRAAASRPAWACGRWRPRSRPGRSRGGCARWLPDGPDFEGYEIHVGATTADGPSRPPLEVEGRAEGCVSADGRVWGTYVHALFEQGAARRRVLAYDRIADALAACLDPRVLRELGAS